MRSWMLASMLVLATGVARADVYTWTDAEGVQHFTNVKPKGGGDAKWKKVLSSTPEAGSKASMPRGSRYDKVGATDHSPERFHKYDQFIAEASDLYKIPVPLIRAIIKTESDYDPHVVSGMDCKGLMQVHPAVQIDMGTQGDVFDPRTNIMTGTRLLRYLANRVDGDLVLTIAGYHAGLGSLQKFGYTVPPYAYTRQYLKVVLERYYQNKQDEAKAASR